LELPLGIVRSVDGTGRLFLLEQAGKVRVVRDGQLLEAPFLDIVAKVGCCGERGLLGMAFHPQFSQNGFVYIHYSDLNGDTRISRYKVSPDNPNQLELTSEREILSLAQPYRNHNGGEISFGPDGYLYIGLGDGGSAGDPQGNGQSTQTLLGKILRIDVDGGDPYAIPVDNPFTEGGGLPEIWAYGLRNPWRFFFDPLNGELYIGDVGQNEWEEVNYLPPESQGGVNFGWNYLEGTHPFRGSPPSDLVLTGPVAEYNHDLGCSVTGGVVYRGDRLPEWRGVFLYGDYCSGNVWGLWRDAQSAWNSALLFRTGFNISAFGIDDSGEVYLSDYGGAIYRLER
jgi:glucose/arabinose dehydrogenase